MVRMRGFSKFIRRTTIGGALFLVPIAVIAIVVGKIVGIIRPAAERVAGLLGPTELGPFLLVILTVLALAALAFVAGLLASTIVGQALVEWLEATVLNHVPGYAIVKSAAVST